MWCQVKDGKVVQGPCPLPESTKHISGFNKLTPEELKKFGWIPCQEMNTVLADEKVNTFNLTVKADCVEVTFVTEKLTFFDKLSRAGISPRDAAFALILEDGQNAPQWAIDHLSELVGKVKAIG